MFSGWQNPNFVFPQCWSPWHHQLLRISHFRAWIWTFKIYSLGCIRKASESVGVLVLFADVLKVHVVLASSNSAMGTISQYWYFFFNLKLGCAVITQLRELELEEKQKNLLPTGSGKAQRFFPRIYLALKEAFFLFFKILSNFAILGEYLPYLESGCEYKPSKPSFLFSQGGKAPSPERGEWPRGSSTPSQWPRHELLR